LGCLHPFERSFDGNQVFAQNADSIEKTVERVFVKDSNGIPYIVITCTECLRSFPLNVTREENPEVLETLCLFCSNKVKYILDFSLSVASPPRGLSASVRTGAVF
jgi:hypothetical protein